MGPLIWIYFSINIQSTENSQIWKADALFYIILYKRFENPQIHRGSWNQSPVDTKGWKWKIICNFFLLQEMLVPLNPHKGSLYFQSWEFNNFQEKIWGNFSQFDIDLKSSIILISSTAVGKIVTLQNIYHSSKPWYLWMWPYLEIGSLM